LPVGSLYKYKGVRTMSKQYGVESYYRYLQGDDKGLEELVAEYGDALVRFAYCIVRESSVAEDAVADVFARMALKRKAFFREGNLRAYLYKAVRNKCMDYLRFHRKRVSLSDLENVLIGNRLETDLLSRERNKTLYCCMQRLALQYAQVLYLVYLEGQTIDEASKIMKKSKKQTYNLLARAKASLKDLLQKEGICL